MNFIIWVLFPSIVVVLIICQFKEKIWQVFALLGCIALTIFIGTTTQLYWQKGSPNFTNMWNVATGVFTFFGVLLTAGAAFATVAAVISYFSVNQKLKEAKSSLKKFKQLDQERKQLQAKLETMASYEAIVQDLQQHDATDKQSQQESLQAAQQILANPQAGFEARLKARAIIQDDKIYREFEQVDDKPSDEAWQQIIAMRQENLAVWKLLFQAAPKADDAYDKALNNYVIALFNYGTAYLFYGDYLNSKQNISTTNRTLEWEKAIEQFEKALKIKPDHYPSKINAANALVKIAYYKNEKEKEDIFKQAEKLYREALNDSKDREKPENYNGLGSLLERKVTIYLDKDNEQCNNILIESMEYFIKALKKNKEYAESADNYFYVLNQLLKFTSDYKEKDKLLTKAKGDIQQLYNNSQSKVIQELLDKLINLKIE